MDAMIRLPNARNPFGEPCEAATDGRIVVALYDGTVWVHSPREPSHPADWHHTEACPLTEGECWSLHRDLDPGPADR